LTIFPLWWCYTHKSGENAGKTVFQRLLAARKIPRSLEASVKKCCKWHWSEADLPIKKVSQGGI